MLEQRAPLRCETGLALGQRRGRRKAEPGKKAEISTAGLDRVSSCCGEGDQAAARIDIRRQILGRGRDIARISASATRSLRLRYELGGVDSVIQSGKRCSFSIHALLIAAPLTKYGSMRSHLYRQLAYDDSAPGLRRHRLRTAQLREDLRAAGEIGGKVDVLHPLQPPAQRLTGTHCWKCSGPRRARLSHGSGKTLCHCTA